MFSKSIFLWLLSLFTMMSGAYSCNTVYIYAGPGASKTSLAQTFYAIEPFLKPHYRLAYIFPEQLINENWENDAALLIFPGGADIPYTIALNGVGNQKIRSYVENGGSFLGICAGSYYGGAFVEFAKNTPLEVLGERELSFFPGIVQGPILAPYDYLTESGARAAEIVWRDDKGFERNKTFKVYYNGGGHFKDASRTNCTTILANYSIGENFAAIVECQVGLGKAILSGVHFEYNPDFLDSNDEYLQQIIPFLKEENGARIELIKHLLHRLNVL